MSKRKSFVLHKDSLDILEELTDEQAGKLFKAIRYYQLGMDIELDQITKLVFSPFKNQFTRDDDKYIETCERRAIAGSKGGKQKVANASNSKQKVAKVAESKSVSKSDSDSKSVSKSKDIKDITKGRFTPPSDIETVAYFESKGSNHVEAQKFWLFYDSKNWMVGKSKMKKWQSAASGWITRNKTDSKDIMQMSADSDWHLQNQGF